MSKDTLDLTGAMQIALLFAARYAHHRNTGGASMVVTALKQCWHKIDDQTKDQIIRESHEATANLDDWQSLRDFANEKGKGND